MKKLTTAAASAAIVSAFSAGNVNANENPLGMPELTTVYNAALPEGTSGEGKGGSTY